MATVRECPLCGGTMKLRSSEQTVHVPGNPRPVKKISQEWVCPECDYFEDADEDRM
jgi:transposase